MFYILIPYTIGLNATVSLYPPLYVILATDEELSADDIASAC